MKYLKVLLLSVVALAVLSCKELSPKVDKYAIDCTQIRGFNYTPAVVAEPRHHIDTWCKYDEATIDFDLDLAEGLKLNFARVFVPYQCYEEMGDTLAVKLKDFAQRCEKRHIKFMPVVGSGAWVWDSTKVDKSREWVEFLVKTLSNERSLAMWDLMNEPDLNTRMAEKNYENCKKLYSLFKEYDPQTPLTIGFQLVPNMIKMGDYADILQFHDYSETRAGIRRSIDMAQAYADSVGKKVFNGEMGCIARANPYDVTIEEHMKANMGWCIWELMIVRKGWGTVHGVFYEDGTVRDPSIPAAILGYFRNRDDVMTTFPDREDKIGSILFRIDKWKKDGGKDFERGIRTAEAAANVLESAELAPMYEAPNWQVNKVRKSQDIKELRALLDKFYKMLKPYKKPDVKK